MMRVRLPGRAPVLLALAALVAAGTATAAEPLPQPVHDVRPGETLVTLPPLPAGAEIPASRGAVVALPPDARTATATVIAGQAAAAELLTPLPRLRGVPVAVVTVRDAGADELVIAIGHDGHWDDAGGRRLASATLHAGLRGRPVDAAKSLDPATGGSYVIITAPQFAGAVQTLADWKLRKGWPVRVVTTDETGTANAGIQAWLREAYQTWDLPPEYVLLVGDVDSVPSWSFSGNVSDLPYALLDGDDWLPDVMLGRFSVANLTECQALVAKTVHYEQSPYLDHAGWFTRSVMVAGQYASTTPMHTVRFFGDQLAGIGFDPMEPVHPDDFSDPQDWGYSDGNYIVSPLQNQLGFGVRQNEGPGVIKDALDAGSSMVVYRGWAYGAAGWEPPHYTVSDIPSLANGAMTPVVMSFVCLNGDFAAAEPCFGEVFTRVGGAEPEQFKGAVAFIGNGEHWSHTRYNDSMAISVAERITDPAITTLGGLLNAGKLRFLEYFPGHLDDQGDEDSVEFYFYIYNLLGDPELNFYRASPTAMTVSHPAALAEGATAVVVHASEADGATPLASARVGVVQADRLLGRALTDQDGHATVVLTSPPAAGPVQLTVSHADRVPYQHQFAVGDGSDFVVMTDLGLGDGEGNDDGVANPGEPLSLLPTFRNLGDQATSTAVVDLAVDGPATVNTSTVPLPALAGGATGQPDGPLALSVLAAAADGQRITGTLRVDRGSVVDDSGFELIVAAPDLRLSATTADGETWLEPGATTDLTLTLANHGSVSTAGGTLDLTLVPLAGATLQTSSVTFGPVAPGAAVACGPVTIALDPGVAAGQSLVLQTTAAGEEGAVQERSLAVAIGDGAPGEPFGPDAHGYYAYDSADYLYPDQRPVYRWTEISTAFGGPGTELDLDANNYATDVTVDLPFTFRFYGEDFDRIRVSDNGWLSFHDADDSYNFYNWPLPSVHGNGAVVAPFWDNLNTEPMPDPESDPVGLDADGVYWHHDAQTGEFIVEWSRMRHYKTVVAEDESGPGVTDLKTFQAVLRDPAMHATPTGDGEILFYYREVVDNDYLRMYASVGIESPDETDGLQLTYDGLRAPGVLEFGPGQAVRITTAPPRRVPLAVTGLVREPAGDRIQVSWRCEDARPILGWRLVTADAARRVLTDQPLPASARQALIDAPAGAEVMLEALLPHGTTVTAGTARAAAATTLRLRAASPNPMRGETSLAFALPRAGNVRLRVFDVRGRRVRTLVDGQVAAGEAVAVWRGRDDRGRSVADGVYFYQLEHAGQTLTRKLLLMR